MVILVRLAKNKGPTMHLTYQRLSNHPLSFTRMRGLTIQELVDKIAPSYQQLEELNDAMVLRAI